MANHSVRSLGGPRHAWTREDRIILTLLYRFYANPEPSLFQIWNVITRDTLLSEGFPNGELLATTLSNQYYELGRTDGEVFQQVMKEPLSTIRERYSRQKCCIENAAQQLGITLMLRIDRAKEPQNQHAIDQNHNSRVAFTRDDWSPSSVASVQHQFPASNGIVSLNNSDIRAFMFNNETDQTESDTTTLDESRNIPSTATTLNRVNPGTKSGLPPSGSDETHCAVGPQNTLPIFQSTFHGVHVPITTESTTPSTPWRNPLTNVRQSPKLVSTFDSDGSHARRHPVLLFRAFDPEHGLVARRFLRGQAISKPPTVQSQDFKSFVSPHLHVDKDYDSPFLSLTQFPRYALRILWASPSPKHLAVFIYNDLDEEGRLENRIRPRLVTRIVGDHNLNSLPGHYRGCGEFLVWGKIDSKPMLVLSTIQAKELFSHLSSMNECCPGAAFDLYPFFKEVDYDHLETLVRSLVTGFKIPGYDWNYHSTRWESFADSFFHQEGDDSCPGRDTSVLSRITVEQSYLQDDEAYITLPEDCTDEAGRIEPDYGPQYIGTEAAMNTELDLGVTTTSEHQGPSAEADVINDDDDDDIVELLDQRVARSSSTIMISTRFPSLTVPVGFSSPVRIDLTSENLEEMEGLTDSNRPKPAQQGERPLQSGQVSEPVEESKLTITPTVTDIGDGITMLDDSDEGFVILSEGRRALSIRSHSCATPDSLQTPAPMSRFIDRHIEQLDFD